MDYRTAWGLAVHCTHLDKGDAFLVQQRRRDEHILVAQEGLQQQPNSKANTAIWGHVLREMSLCSLVLKGQQGRLHQTGQAPAEHIRAGTPCKQVPQTALSRNEKGSTERLVTPHV